MHFDHAMQCNLIGFFATTHDAGLALCVQLLCHVDMHVHVCIHTLYACHGAYVSMVTKHTVQPLLWELCAVLHSTVWHGYSSCSVLTPTPRRIRYCDLSLRDSALILPHPCIASLLRRLQLTSVMKIWTTSVQSVATILSAELYACLPTPMPS